MFLRMIRMALLANQVVVGLAQQTQCGVADAVLITVVVNMSYGVAK